MKKFIQVFWFNFMEKMSTKAAIITNIILFAAIFGFFGVSDWLSNRETDSMQIAIVQQSDIFVLEEDALNGLTDSVDFTVLPATAYEQARQDFEAGQFDKLMVVEGTEIPALHTIANNFGSLGSEGERIVSHLLQQQYMARVMARDDISSQLMEELQAPIVMTHETSQSVEDFLQNFALTYVMGLILLTVLVTYGNQIGYGVVSEKSSRVMEVMISKVRPSIMMYAKITAVLGTVLVNVAALLAGYFAAGILGWTDLSNINVLGMPLDLTQIDGLVFVSAFVFLILGYLFFAMLFAAVGAICSKQEDYTNLSVPLQYVGIIPFFAMMFMEMDSMSAHILSYVPLFSPFITFARFAEGHTGLMEVGITILILLISIIVLSRFATKLFVGGVMHYSEKTSFKDIKKLMKA